MIERYPHVTRVWAGGMSFGAWVAMTAGADDPKVTALIGVAPPVTQVRFFSAVTTAAKPTFLIHGERDELVPFKDVSHFYARLARTERAGRHRRRGPSFRRQGQARWATPSRICCRISMD